MKYINYLPDPVGPRSRMLLFSNLSSCEVLSKISEPLTDCPGRELTGLSKEPPKLKPILPFPRPAKNNLSQNDLENIYKIFHNGALF